MEQAKLLKVKLSDLGRNAAEVKNIIDEVERIVEQLEKRKEMLDGLVSKLNEEHRSWTVKVSEQKSAFDRNLASERQEIVRIRKEAELDRQVAKEDRENAERTLKAAQEKERIANDTLLKIEMTEKQVAQKLAKLNSVFNEVK